jgi:hypothetical protein
MKARLKEQEITGVAKKKSQFAFRSHYHPLGAQNSSCARELKWVCGPIVCGVRLRVSRFWDEDFSEFWFDAIP